MAPLKSESESKSKSKSKSIKMGCSSGRKKRRTKLPRVVALQGAFSSKGYKTPASFSSFDLAQHNMVYDDFHLRDNPDDYFGENSCVNCATMALKNYDDDGRRNHELLDIGPIGVGCLPRGHGHVMHLNFQARIKDEPSAAVKTFFCEVIKSNGNDADLVCVSCLGPISKLPDKALPVGCLYCPHNMHHPGGKFINGYHTGREERYCFLVNKIKSFRTQFRNNELSPRISHPGVKYFGAPFTDSMSHYATAALCLYNKTKKTNFEFVKPGFSGLCLSPIGKIRHVNFDAKNLDDPDAGEQTFFAEVVSSTTFLFAAFCECLGPSNLLAGKTQDHGCCYCPRCIFHPPGPGYVNGREYWQD